MSDRQTLLSSVDDFIPVSQQRASFVTTTASSAAMGDGAMGNASQQQFGDSILSTGHESERYMVSGGDEISWEPSLKSKRLGSKRSGGEHTSETTVR